MKIVAVGRNYREHVEELGDAAPPQWPRIFFKPPSALIRPGQAIVLPPESAQVEHEAELGVVIGGRGAMRRVPAADALAYVHGYCAVNDVTARDIQRRDGIPDYAKAFDTFCPMGPVLDEVAGEPIDPGALSVECYVNDELRQSAPTSSMLTPVPELLAYISAAMTLEPGDLVLTGTPAGTGPLKAGDIVEVRISGLPTLWNPVR